MQPASSPAIHSVPIPPIPAEVPLPETRDFSTPAMQLSPMRRLAWDAGVILGLLAFIGLSYIEALHAGFVYWDDDDLLLVETRYRSLANVGWMFTSLYSGHYQPLTWLSYWLDWQIWNREAFGFHLTNVVLHSCGAIAFYFVAKRLIHKGMAGGQGNRAVTSAALPALSAGFAAVFFAIHPLRVESVAWIAERRDVLSGLFFFLAVHAYLRYVDDGCGRASRRISYLMLLIFMSMSLLSKAAAVMLPLVLLVLDWYPLRRISAGNRFTTRNTRIFLEKIPLFTLSMFAGATAVIAQSRMGAMYPIAEHGWGSRAAQACYGLAFYVWKTFLPARLGPLYELPSSDVLLGPMLLVSGGVVIFVAIVALAVRRILPAVPATLATYALLIFPVLGFFQSGPQLVADRYAYLSCAGFAVCFGGIVYWLGTRCPGEAQRGPRMALVLSSVVLIGTMHGLTYAQCRFWHSDLRLWNRGVSVSPKSTIAHANYADALARAEILSPAIAHYGRSLELNPRNVVATAHLGDVLGLVNQREKAINLYKRALELEPNRPKVHHKLADLLIKSKRANEGVEILEARLAVAPDDLDAMELLVDVLSSHPDSQIRNSERAIIWAQRLSDSNALRGGVALMFLATAQAHLGRVELAMSTGERAMWAARARNDFRLEREVRRRLRLFREQGGLYPKGE